MTKELRGQLVLATHNAGKLAEMAAILAPYPVTLVSSASLGLPEPVETEDSFVGNARLKAHAAASASGLPALADDSGICVAALVGAPGVYTADWAETGNGRDFGVAMTRTHRAILDSGAAQPWRAWFCSTLVLAWPDGSDQVFEGRVDGAFVWPMRGVAGHGYDPCFLPDGSALTFAEMDPAVKNQISHRAIALAKFISECFT